MAPRSREPLPPVRTGAGGGAGAERAAAQRVGADGLPGGSVQRDGWVSRRARIVFWIIEVPS